MTTMIETNRYLHCRVNDRFSGEVWRDNSELVRGLAR